MEVQGPGGPWRAAWKLALRVSSTCCAWLYPSLIAPDLVCNVFPSSMSYFIILIQSKVMGNSDL